MKKILIGVGAAIIKDKKLLLTKRLSNKKLFPNFWTFPAGGYEETDESLKNTAIREVKKEVGLIFKPTKKLNFYEHQNEDSLGVSHVYLGEWTGKVIFQTQEKFTDFSAPRKYNVFSREEEISEIGWFTYEETKSLDIAFAYRDAIEDLHELSLIE